jgi:hypothetical protein
MPYVSIHVDPEDVLDDIDDDTVADHLRKQGYYVVPTASASHTGADGIALSDEDLGRLSTLLMCGQQEAALEELFSLVNPGLTHTFDLRKALA